MAVSSTAGAEVGGQSAVTAAALAGEDPIIEVNHVTLRFGGVTSLADVTLGQRRGEVLAVIGPNGAGKTSLFNCLTGVYVPQHGTIRFNPAGAAPVELIKRRGMLSDPFVMPSWRRFSGKPRATRPDRINRFGIARTFQASRLFSALTAFENVKIGAEARQRTGPVGAMLHLPRTRREERESDRRAMELLEFVGLRELANELAASLPYGAQRRLEIARALATKPELLLLDEPAAGTNPSEKVELAQLIGRVNSELGVSVLLIEHDMRLVMSLAVRIIVLNFGAVIAAGTPAEIQRNPAVVEAYLGTVAQDGAAGTETGTPAAGTVGAIPPALAGASPAADSESLPGADLPAGAGVTPDPAGDIPDPFVAAESWPISFPDAEEPGSVPPEER